MNPEANKAVPIALVIDDEPQIRRLLRVTLEANGYRVFDAATGHDGVAQAAQRRPDVVLLDLGLPDLEGVEVLRRLREWSKVPVIILSVRDREDDKVSTRLIRRDGQEVKLTPIEYSLLRLLITHAGKVLTHRQLLTEVWGPKAGEQTHYLRVHIAHLRDKIEKAPGAPELIRTEPGIGYRLVESER